MKRNRIPSGATSRLVGTDGTTLFIETPHYRSNLFTNPDLKSNPLWLPDTNQEHLEEVEMRSSKYKNYNFSFASLVNKKEPTN